MANRERQEHSHKTQRSGNEVSRRRRRRDYDDDNTDARGIDEKSTKFTNVKRRKLLFNNSNKKQNKEERFDVKMDEQFRQLDSSIPEEARRIQQRYRAIMKGKNTVGYDQYIRKVPKHKRNNLREHPSTPNHTLDIPNRRWLGLVKAWRIALHKYDPKNLQTEFDTSTTEIKKPVAKEKQQQTVKEKEIAEASNKGLLVDFHTEESSTKPMQTEPSISIIDTSGEMIMKELDDIEANHDELFLDFDDSDDDLL